MKRRNFMSSKATSDFRRNRKANLIKVCGNRCNLCGYDKAISGLEFHHIDPETKSYGLASMGTCHQLEIDLNEIKKCILVCANCHREIHEGLYTKEELLLKRIYLNDIAEQLIEERNNLQKKTIYYCKDCGKEISRGAIRCEACNRKIKRVVQDRPSREELKQLIRTTPFVKIGEKFGVSDNSIRKWCISENLPSKVSKIKQYTNEEWDKI